MFAPFVKAIKSSIKLAHRAQLVNALLFTAALFLLSSGSEAASSPFVARLLVAPGIIISHIREKKTLFFVVRKLADFYLVVSFPETPPVRYFVHVCNDRARTSFHRFIVRPHKTFFRYYSPIWFDISLLFHLNDVFSSLAFQNLHSITNLNRTNCLIWCVHNVFTTMMEFIYHVCGFKRINVLTIYHVVFCYFYSLIRKSRGLCSLFPLSSIYGTVGLL